VALLTHALLAGLEGTAAAAAKNSLWSVFCCSVS